MATIRVQVRGERDEVAMIRPAVGEPFADLVKSEVKDAVRVERGRAELPTLVTGPIADDDVVEVEIEDGLRLWIRGSEVESELGAVRRRGVDADMVEIPEALPRRSLQRGLGTWLLRGLRIIKVDPAEKTPLRWRSAWSSASCRSPASTAGPAGRSWPRPASAISEGRTSCSCSSTGRRRRRLAASAG